MRFFDKVKKSFKSSEIKFEGADEGIVKDFAGNVADDKKFKDAASFEKSSDVSESFKSHDFEDDESGDVESSGNYNILFLCATNTMISPIAEAVYNDKIGTNNVFSAGLFAPEGEKVSSTAINLCRRNGIDLSKRDVTHIRDVPIEEMDLILTFKEYHRDWLKAQYPDLNIFTYLEYGSYFSSTKSVSWDYYDDEDDQPTAEDLNILDYFDGNFSSFEHCFDRFVSKLKMNDTFRDEFTSNEKFINFKFLDYYIHRDVNEFKMDCDAINVNQFDLTIEIDRDDLTIDGDGHVIDSLGKNRIFIISAKNITLKNITFKNGFSTITGNYTADGGAIYIMGGSVTIENCVFINNHSLNGGAVYCDDSGKAHIKNCKFIDNSSTEFGGAIRGSYYADDKLIVEDCQFMSNSSDIGGAVSNGSYVGCDFSANTALRYGGASSRGLFVKCDFSENFAGQSGGACDSVSAEECNFTDNSSGDCGGASSGGGYKQCIFKGNSSNYGGAFSEGGLLEDCRFIENRAKIEGHAIHTKEDLKIWESCFEDSFPDDSSCIISYKGNDNENLNIKNSVFDSGLSKLINIQQGYSYIYGLKIKNNNKYAVFNQNGTVEIHKPKFNSGNGVYNNKNLYINSDEFKDIPIEEGSDSRIFYLDKGVSDSLKGFTYLESIIEKEAPEVNLNEDILLSEIEQRFYEGGIELNHDYIEIDGNNHIIDANGLSRIFLITGKKIILKNIIFKNGKDFYDEFSMSSSGAIHTFEGTDLTIVNCKFINNISKNSVGAISSRGNSLTIKDTLFLGNHGEGHSVGAIYNEADTFEIVGCEFRDNSARYRAGAIHNKEGDLTCINSSFIANESKAWDAGAIWIESGNSFFKGCSFSNNRAEEKGGAIYAESDFVIEECRFEGNESSTSFGGAIKCVSLDVSKSVFIENSSQYGGGAIDTVGLTLDYCSLERNRSKRGGGAVDVSSDCSKLSNSSFIENRSESSGGAINCAASSKLKLSNLLFDSNSADYSGGAIKSDGLHMSDCKFINNHSKEFSGAISNSGEANIFNCQFISNSSDKVEGILELSGYSHSKIEKCEFKVNNAKIHEIVRARDNDVKFTDCRFGNNSLLDEEQILEEIKNIDDGYIRSSLTYCIHDDEVLADLLFNDPSERVRSAALNNISNEEIINEIALRGEIKSLRVEAIERVVDKSVLEYLSMHGEYVEITFSAQRRLQKLGY